MLFSCNRIMRADIRRRRAVLKYQMLPRSKLVQNTILEISQCCSLKAQDQLVTDRVSRQLVPLLNTLIIDNGRCEVRVYGSEDQFYS